MAINKIVRNSITGDAIDATKVADDAISEEHLDVTAITGNSELAATAADDDVLLVFDTSAGTIKKIAKSNVALQAPTFSSVSPTSLLSGDGTGNHTIVVTGTKFDATATFKLQTSGGTDITMDSVTRNSATQLTGVVAKNKANLTNANEPFDIIITNTNGLTTTGANQINIDASPVYVTAAGTLGTKAGGSALSPAIDIVATDPDSAGNVTFEFQSGALPAGLSSATVNENGVSKFRISGTPTNPAANTTTNFTLRAVDAASNTSSRAFSLTITRTVTTESFTSSGTFSVPAGVSQADVLVVAGGGGSSAGDSGGGGAGGLIFFPDYPVTASGTIVVTVGDGGATTTHPNSPGPSAPDGNPGNDSIFGASPSPGLGQGGILTAKGGGGGGGFGDQGLPGGSGGGHGRDADNSTNPTATQPTQSGNSGAYGFGNVGGYSPGPDFSSAGGGGGAGAAGTNGSGPGGGASEDNSPGGAGGIGKAYTIADGTSPVYYAGGGGGAAYSNVHGQIGIGVGGQGGGGSGAVRGPYAPSLPTPFPTNGAAGQAGGANKGGGAGGSAANGNPQTGQAGGKGVVIVRY